LLIDRAREFAGIAFQAAAQADDTRRIDDRIWQAFQQAGLGLAPFGEAFGGAGLGEPQHQGELCILLRIIGAADLSIARLFEGHVNAISLVTRYGSKAQIERLAADVQKGALTGVWGAEDSVGLKRQQRPNGWQLEGRKILASGAGSVQRPLVTLTSPQGPLMYLLALEADGEADLENWRPLGMRATATGTVDLTGVMVTSEQQIGAPGDYMTQPFFSGGAWRFCAAQLGACERLTELYRDQLRARGRGEDPYQLERLAQCAAACGTALFWVEEAARRFADDTQDAATTVAFANLTRMVTERAALDVMERVQRGIGLFGFIQPNPVERICRDLATYLRQPVPDLAMSDAARAVLSGQLAIGAFS
jgi:alkylation response protein AidB-like acyl-CoA dehydrogenase